MQIFKFENVPLERAAIERRMDHPISISTFLIRLVALEQAFESITPPETSYAVIHFDPVEGRNIPLRGNLIPGHGIRSPPVPSITQRCFPDTRADFCAPFLLSCADVNRSGTGTRPGYYDCFPFFFLFFSIFFFFIFSFISSRSLRVKNVGHYLAQFFFFKRLRG